CRGLPHKRLRRRAARGPRWCQGLDPVHDQTGRPRKPYRYSDRVPARTLWVRSHYDTATLSIADAPLPDEILLALAVTNRGRLNARLGGLAKEDVRGKDGLR